MRVLVAIEMGNNNSCRLQFANLRLGLGFDLIFIKTAGKRRQKNFAQRIPEPKRLTFHQRRHLRSIEDRLAIRQHDMASNAKLRNRSRKLDSILKRGPICHQRRGSHNALLMALQNGAIDP